MSYDLSKINVEHMLEILGVQNITPGLEEIQFSCPYPSHERGDRNPSASINRYTTVFFCFSCRAKGTAVNLVSEVEGISPVLAIKWLREAYGLGQLKGGSSVVELNSILREEAEKEEAIICLDKKYLEYFKVDWFGEFARRNPEPWASYMFDRGFHTTTLTEWDIGHDPYIKRITIPIFDINGYLLGFKGRAWQDKTLPKYRVLGDKDKRYNIYGFKPYLTSKVVFGLNKVSLDSSQAILSEGELNTIKLHQSLFNNSIGISGSYLSEYQADIIKANFDSVILFFDSDKAGEEGTQRAVKLLEPTIQVFTVPEHEGDPCDLSADEIRSLLASKKSVIMSKI